MTKSKFCHVERIAFVSTRIHGTDGVSLEIKKWATILERLGYECQYIAGLLDRPAERSFLIEAAHFDHTEIRELNRRCFDRVQRTRQVTRLIHELTLHIKNKLYEARAALKFDLLIIENSVTIPMNIPLGLALVEFVSETAIPCIAHHHDFVWERERFLVNAVDDLLAQAFPPPMSRMIHVGINSMAVGEFSRRQGLPCELIPNVMDFANPPEPPDDYALSFCETIGLKADERMILQPTRIVRRKQIEIAIELVQRLGDRRFRLVISHAGGDEGDRYVKRIRSFARLLGVELIFADEFLADERGIRDDGKRLYTIRDAYAAAEMVTYPSGYEGFGNAFLEAVYYRKPIVCNRYAIYRTDIEPCGFDELLMDGFVTDDIVEQMKAVLNDPERAEKMTETNYRVAGRFFSFEKAEEQLKMIIHRIESKAVLIDAPQFQYQNSAINGA